MFSLWGDLSRCRGFLFHPWRHDSLPTWLHEVSIDHFLIIFPLLRLLFPPFKLLFGVSHFIGNQYSQGVSKRQILSWLNLKQVRRLHGIPSFRSIIIFLRSAKVLYTFCVEIKRVNCPDLLASSKFTSSLACSPFGLRACIILPYYSWFQPQTYIRQQEQFWRRTWSDVLLVGEFVCVSWLSK